MNVEVRVPTYKRPGLLRRALESLRTQTYSNWVARIFDDSPSQEGREVCNSLGDGRIQYEPNPENLGICRNLDRCFSIPPLPKSAFLCVLEDDNYYLPSCLSSNVSALTKTGLDIMLRNQAIETMTGRDEPGRLTSRATYDDQYHDGQLEHARLFASFFYSTGANNSSLFWRVKVGLDFSTINYVTDVVAQERLRTLCIDRDVMIGIDPLIVWRDNGEETLRPKLTNRLEWRVSQIKAAADERAIYKALATYLKHSGSTGYIFSPPSGKFNASRERVLHRVGLTVPADFKFLSAVERYRIHLKRLLAIVGAHAFAYSPKLSISPTRRRLQ